MYLDLNVIQSVPASNINRDSTGAPKVVDYGGVQRSRVSSQAWKHAMRHDFAKQEENSDLALLSYRTKLAPELIANSMMKQKPAIDPKYVFDQITLLFGLINIKLDAKSKDENGFCHKSSVLLSLPKAQIDIIGKYLLEHKLAKNDKDLKTYLKQSLYYPNSGSDPLDLALFGRMVAADPTLNVDAASQVAHAFSTHEVETQYDYFSAADDLSNQGSGMLGTIDFNSSTMYRYANLNIDELKHNLCDAQTGKVPNGVLSKAVKLFVTDFIYSMPTGYQNSFANKTLPFYVLAVLRDDTPVNLATAFEKPVVSNDGYNQLSVDRLEDEYLKTNKMVDKPVLASVLTTGNTKLEDLAVNNRDEFIQKVLNGLDK